MLSDFYIFNKEQNLVRNTSRTLLAVSGGVDSVVMARLFHRAGFSFDIAHANFQLREDESDRDELFVRNLAEKYKVKIFVKHFETAKFARIHKVTIQVAARQLRYEWFDELLLKHGYDQLATAHHLDDQVETFLINLTRGTGIAGLHGIPVRQGKVVRPMLFAGRKEIEAYAAANNLDFVQDSSNLSIKYTRNRIRHKIIPQLELINPAFRQELTQTISFIRDAEKIYRQTIEQKRNEIFSEKGDNIYIKADQLLNLKPLETWAYELLSPFGFNLSNVKDIINMESAIPGKEVVSVSHRLIRDRDRLIIVPLQSVPQKQEYYIAASDIQHGISKPLNLSFEILQETPVKFEDPNTSAYLAFEKLEFPLQIRKWKQGDFFFPLGMSKRKKLSDFFTDQKFSVLEKEEQWILCSGKNIVWVVGHRIDDRYKITSSSKMILKINLFPEVSAMQNSP